MLLFCSWTVALGALIPVASGALVPTGPGPLDIFRVGEFCSINWTPDDSSAWTNVTIDLMSGPNDNMNWVATVAQGLDGSDPALVPYNWTCPDVHPYGPIYFYQFTQQGQAAQWTTRFTISSASGETAPAEHASQPNGDQVAWGTGHAESAGAGAGNVGTGGSPGTQVAQSGSANDANTPSTGDVGTGTAHSHPGVDSANVDATTPDGPVSDRSSGHPSGSDQYSSSNATVTSSRRPRPSRLSSPVPTIPLPSNYQEMLDDFNQYTSWSGKTEDLSVQRLLVPLVCAIVFVIW